MLAEVAAFFFCASDDCPSLGSVCTFLSWFPFLPVRLCGKRERDTCTHWEKQVLRLSLPSILDILLKKRVFPLLSVRVVCMWTYPFNPIWRRVKKNSDAVFLLFGSGLHSSFSCAKRSFLFPACSLQTDVLCSPVLLQSNLTAGSTTGPSLTGKVLRARAREKE